MPSYEDILSKINSLANGVSPEFRDVKWLSRGRVIGVARDHDGRVELFLSGVELRPISKPVKDVIEFRSWNRDGLVPFQANRLRMPALGHFDQVAAFVCAELLRAGADDSLSHAFAVSEPIIELAIEQLNLSDQVIIGLAGELLLLEALCRNARDSDVSSVVEFWDGWRRSSRDFVCGSTGVEVKTTLQANSTHAVEGIHQVERSDGSFNRPPEEQFFLVSIGLTTATSLGDHFTISSLVNILIGRIRSTCEDSQTVVENLLDRIAEYGGGPAGGYDHRSSDSRSSYSVQLSTTFFRCYDMSDDAIEVLRTKDVVTRRHVDMRSLRFRISLPVVVSANNPVVGANKVSQTLLNRSE